jgi:hypothetical protein
MVSTAQNGKPDDVPRDGSHGTIESSDRLDVDEDVSIACDDVNRVGIGSDSFEKRARAFCTHLSKRPRYKTPQPPQMLVKTRLCL